MSWDNDLADGGDVLISALEHYSYCPRQCGLIHVEQTYTENVYTVRGQLLHRRVDSGEEETRGDVITRRDVPLWSVRLGLRGKADLVEFRSDEVYPVEYKSGRRRSRHAELQLCAQALCLEEMLATSVGRGAIFYGGLRRRREVLFDDTLRRQTEAVIAAVRAMLIGQRLPPAKHDARCTRCSLRDVCLPQVLDDSHRLRGLQGDLFRVRPLDEGIV